MKEQPKTRILVTLDPRDYEQIAQLAKADCRSMASWVRALVSRTLASTTPATKGTRSTGGKK